VSLIRHIIWGVWGMRRFLMRRLFTSLLAVLGVVVAVFLLLHVVPGDPVDNLLGEDARPQDKLELRRCMDLDQPMPVQLYRFLRSVGDGTLGYSCPDRKRTVAGRIAEVMPHTVALAVSAMIVALLLALPLGVVAALRPRSGWDTAATAAALSGISMPSMWLGPVLLFLFFIRPAPLDSFLPALPGPGEDTDRLAGLILPSIMLGTHLMAMLARMTRSSLLDTLGEDYVRTARAKGLSEDRVVIKHALRNAMLPVITVAGMQFGALLAGAVVTEKVFARPGLGTLLLDAISQRDYRVVQGCALVIAVLYVGVNLLVDLLYAATDPRIRV
jgi:peptide/nickel transport system permease protein